MSAFICGPDHFKALAIFAASRTHGYGSASLRVDPRYIHYGNPTKGLPVELLESRGAELASAYADILYAENVRSVQARYPDDKSSDLPGPTIRQSHIVVSGQDQILAKYRLPPVSLLKMCDCLEYQSCETEDYRETLGFELLDRIRGAAIKALAGYDDAPWDYTAPADPVRGRTIRQEVYP
jgi:hypothetical protein